MGDDALAAAAADDAHNDVVDHQRLGRHCQTNVSPHRSGHDQVPLPSPLSPFLTYPVLQLHSSSAWIFTTVLFVSYRKKREKCKCIWSTLLKLHTNRRKDWVNNTRIRRDFW